MKSTILENQAPAAALDHTPVQVQPDMGPVLRQQTVVADFEARLGAAQANVAALDSEYRASAQREAMGEQAPGPAAATRLKREDARVPVLGLELALQSERKKLEGLRADYQQALAEHGRAEHAAKFSRLVQDGRAAQAAAVRHWNALAEELGRVEAATDGLRAEEFTDLQGANVAGEIWAPLRSLRSHALNSGLKIRSHDEIGVVALMTAGEQR